MTHSPKQTAWTPGPWGRYGDFFEVCRVEFEGSGSYTTISSRSRIGAPVAFVIGTPDTHWRDDDEQEANAHLIAAAPELYEALAWVTTALEVAESGDPDEYADKAVAFARAALSKARPSNGGEA